MVLLKMKKMLEKEGYEVTSVTTGKETIEKIKLDNYDLLLLDIMMPDLSGWDVFTRITKIDPNKKVIFLTVLEISPERKKQLIEHGVVDYITKPFDRDDFIKVIKSTLGD